MLKEQLISNIIKQISKFSNAIADNNMANVQIDYDSLSKEPINVALLTVIHDIYEDAKTNQWSIARKDALALVEESANRYNDGYGLLSYKSHYTYHIPNEFSDSEAPKIASAQD